jgi:mRNA-degrading endonuclease toxin of MazEF toxin-antitoxin module
MTEYKRGDVVLVRYQQTEEGEERLRPALVVNSGTYYQGRGQMILAAITGNQAEPNMGDAVVEDWEEAGLLGPSLVTGVLVTMTPDSVWRRLGSLTSQDLVSVDNVLHLNLGI